MNAALTKLAEACLETGRALLDANDGLGAAHAFSAMTCVAPDAPEGYVGLDGALRTMSNRSSMPDTVRSLAARGSISPAVAEQVLQVIQDQWPDDPAFAGAPRELQGVGVAAP